MSWMTDEAEARIADDSLVYRIAPLEFCDRDHMLNMKFVRSEGRWHRPQQSTTYTANNIIVCMAEVLFHNYRRVLDGIRDKLPPARLRSCYRKQKVLQIARVHAIDNLAHIESDDFKRQYDLWGMAVVYPDPHYRLYHEITDQLRRNLDDAGGMKNGVVYPSARHSRDLCAALFTDESGKIKEYWALNVTLSLLHEDQTFGGPPVPASPDRDKIHPTMGYYSFDEPQAFRELDNQGVLMPAGLPSKGYIDFVRRRYPQYPTSAVCSCG